MIRRKLVIATVAVAVVYLVGCDSCRNETSHSQAVDAPCVPLDIPDASPGDASNLSDALFVITSWRFGTVDDGLDLDCIDSPEGCRTEACRDAPEDGSNGADNRLGPLALRLSKLSGADLQGEMTKAVERGHHPLLIKLEGVSSYESGSVERVELSWGLDADGDRSDLYTGRGKVRPDPDSPAERPAVFEPAAVRDGVLSAGPAMDWMPLFWTRGQIEAVPVHSAYLKMRVSQAPTGDRLVDGRITEGLLGGSMYPADLSRAILDMDARTAKVLQRLSPIVRALVRQQADLDLIPSGRQRTACSETRGCLSGQRCRGGHCYEPSERLDTISFAIHFEAVSVTE